MAAHVRSGCPWGPEYAYFSQRPSKSIPVRVGPLIDDLLSPDSSILRFIAVRNDVAKEDGAPAQGRAAATGLKTTILDFDHEGMPAPFPLNAQGKGFYLKREQAKGSPLPNLEWPHAPIRAWNDRPFPACWGPVTDPLTWHLAKVAHEMQGSDEAMDRIEERVFLSACQPDLIMPPLAGGEEVVLTGLAAQPFGFRVPAASLRVRAEIGADTVEEPLSISGLWILLTQRLVVVTWRGGFRYTFRQHDKRRATLLET